MDMAGDFNLHLNERDLRRMMKRFHIGVANIAPPYDDPNIWTSKTPCGHLRRLKYMLHSKSLRPFEVSINDTLHLEFDHRNDSASIEYIRYPFNGIVEPSQSIVEMIETNFEWFSRSFGVSLPFGKTKT